MDKRQYRNIETWKFVPLFSKSWWMESACKGKDWDVIDIQGKAALPVQIVRKYGVKAILMPIHTQRTSISMLENAQAHQWLPLLAQQLDTYCYQNHIVWCNLQGNWDKTFCQTLQTYGYRISERKTFCIPSGYTREQVLQRLSENKRRQVKKALGMHIQSITVEDFYEFHRLCLLERGKKIDYSLAFAKSVLETALAKSAAQLWGAFAPDGSLQSAVALVYDEQTCYYWLPTYCEQYKHNGSMAWLTVEAIVWSMNKGIEFDFEGSMVPSIARSYREFGGQERVYYGAEKYYHPIVEKLLKLWLKWCQH